MGQLRVRVTPRATRNGVIGFDPEGVLRVRIAAPPVEGAANEALIGFLADILDVPPSRIRIARGGGARGKTVEVEGMTEADLRLRLAGGASG